MNMIKLKGGSLSSTFLCNDGEKFIRKCVSLTDNREYGYVRWYSQLKKLQRYNQIHRDLFPRIIRTSYTNDQAYFDLEYLEGFRDIKTILTEDDMSPQDIMLMSDTLWRSFTKLHSNILEPNKGAAALYFKEEVEQKLVDAKKVHEFRDFLEYDNYYYHDEKVSGISNYMSKLKDYFSFIKIPYEQTIHGNPTLENTLYSVKENRIVFVDCYEESIIDTKFLDYAQVLQCSRSHYGFINDREVIVNENRVGHNLSIPKSYSIFNKEFESNLDYKKELIDILEATQFIRMLPFKCLAGDLNHAKYFYVHACYLLKKVFDD